MSERKFEDKEAVREAVPLLVGLFGASSSGKTYSALRLASGMREVTGGDIYVTSQLDTFLRLEHAGAELLAKTFQPLVGKVIDYNFLESMAFLGSLSRTAEVNPHATVALTERMTHARPEDQEQLAVLLAEIGQRAADQGTAAVDPGPSGGPRTTRRSALTGSPASCSRSRMAAWVSGSGPLASPMP